MKPARVYIAARFQQIEQARWVATELEKRGLIIGCEWLLEKSHDNPNYTDSNHAECARLARIDFDEVRDADALVLYNPPGVEKFGTGGCHVETGVALAEGLPIKIVGHRSNVFHHLPGIEVYSPDFDGLNRLAQSLGGDPL